MHLTEDQIRKGTAAVLNREYNAIVAAEDIIVNRTRKEFTGDLTVVIFPFTRYTKSSAEITGAKIGEWLKEDFPFITGYNVIKGFLNLEIADEHWLSALKSALTNLAFGQLPASGKKMVVEYCGPNTNKPLHLGHIRNMVIGYSTAAILEAAGHEVHKVNIYNDRGIAICKSMVAWLRKGKGETPSQNNIKGDHFVGKYYVEFSKMLDKEVEELIAQGHTPEEAADKAPIMQEAREMLRKWETNDPDTMELWQMMNDWVYEGFESTYQLLGVDFEKYYYESVQYLSGKALVNEGLEKGIFFQKLDGSVWVDLTAENLDEKLLLRRDGTSVYLTQDLGTAQARYEDFKMDTSIYVVADEQNYHFQVLKATLKKLNKPYAEGIYHLNYGMVDLPTGKMKSREGTSVDADDLIAQMMQTAMRHTSELGKIEDFTKDEAMELYHKIGLGALKYFLLKVNAKKRILFDPEASIQFVGDTGPFIQYTYARIRSVLRKAGNTASDEAADAVSLTSLERDLLLTLQGYPSIIKEAATQYEPSIIAGYLFNLAKSYNKFYQDSPILAAESPAKQYLRLRLSALTAKVIASGMKLLGIDVPERM